MTRCCLSSQGYGNPPSHHWRQITAHCHNVNEESTQNPRGHAYIPQSIPVLVAMETAPRYSPIIHQRAGGRAGSPRSTFFHRTSRDDSQINGDVHLSSWPNPRPVTSERRSFTCGAALQTRYDIIRPTVHPTEQTTPTHEKTSWCSRFLLLLLFYSPLLSSLLPLLSLHFHTTIDPPLPSNTTYHNERRRQQDHGFPRQQGGAHSPQ